MQEKVLNPNRRAVNFTLFILFSGVLFSCTDVSKKSSWKISSPNGKLFFELQHNNKLGNISYRVYKDSITLIEPSPLALLLENRSFFNNLEFAGAEEIKTINDEYTLVSGKQLINSSTANEISVSFLNTQKEKITVIIRAYNDGFAFRYLLSKNNSSSEPVSQSIIKDLTGFKVPEGTNAWLQPYDRIRSHSPAYEKYYRDTIAGASSPNKEGWCMPALFETNKHWLLITEAGHDGSSPAYHLEPNASGRLYYLRPPEKKEANNTGNNLANIMLPWKSPWRIIMVADNLSGIVGSQLVTHVAEPRATNDFSWVKPGRSSWSWWSDKTSCTDKNKLKSFIDLAHEMSWEYSLIDANWNTMPAGTLEELVAYGKEKNVGLFLWYNSGGPHNIVKEQPRNMMIDPIIRKKEMKRLHDIGVKGVKVDFFQSDKQHIIKLYLDILKDAADNQLMINFHGSTIPKGWTRTWPNLLAMESVPGEECYIFTYDYPERAPEHNTLLAFTRNVVGPMDHTPTAFSDNTFPHLTSYGHELALSVLFECGIVHFPDKVEKYSHLEKPAKDFLMQLPVAWDSTFIISGYPGKDVTMVRKKNNTWYIACINGENIKKEASPDLSFLPNAKYKMNLIADGNDAKSFKIDSVLQKISILPYGGYVAVIEPLK